MNAVKSYRCGGRKAIIGIHYECSQVLHVWWQEGYYRDTL